MDLPKKILIIRNDKLGDFMLAWPALRLLKTQYPDAKLTVLVPSYTAPMAEICPWIDHILIDEPRESRFEDIKKLVSTIKPVQFDASISLFSQNRTGVALWLSRIPHRYSPATKPVQLLFNHRLVQRRSRSLKPEYQYNVDLVKYFIMNQGDTPVVEQKTPCLTFNPDDTKELKQRFFAENNIGSNNRLVCVHPGSGGSANNLSLDQYTQLIAELLYCKDLFIVISAGPGEYEIAESLSGMLTAAEIKHCIYHSTDGIVNFAHFISLCYLFISGSTGPLHIAGALDVRTAGFYTARRSATALRWQTLNSENHRLAFSVNDTQNREDMSSVDVVDAAKSIHSTFFADNVEQNA